MTHDRPSADPHRSVYRARRVARAFARRTGSMAVLVPRIRRVSALSTADKLDMLALMQRCYDGVEKTRFLRDLHDKSHVVWMTPPGGDLAGFSTLSLSEADLDGEVVDVLFSGDTVIAPEHWGSKALQVGFGAFCLWHRATRGPKRRLLWLLLSKGYKTYLLMANHFTRAWPRYDTAMPAGHRALRDRLALARFGRDFDPQSGILRFDAARDRVKGGLAEVRPALLENPHVAFFVAQNPGYARGDELVCIGELHAAELLGSWVRAAAYPVLGRGRAIGRHAAQDRAARNRAARDRDRAPDSPGTAMQPREDSHD